MIFFRPVHHGIYNIIIHHRPAGSNIVAAGGTIREAAVLPVPVVISRHHALQPRVLAVSVIVHHIHHHAYAILMQSLNHLFAFSDSDRPVRHIRGIGTLRHIIV